MPNLTPEKFEAILEALQTKAESVPGADNVLIENPLVDSKHDVVEKLTIQNVDGKAEVRFIYWSFLGFQDSVTDGCDDNPSVTLTFNAHVVQEFNEKRSDDSISERDFITLVLNLRNKFLNKNREILPGCETTPLAQTNFIILADDPLTGVYGHIVDLTCKVEID